MFINKWCNMLDFTLPRPPSPKKLCGSGRSFFAYILKTFPFFAVYCKTMWCENAICLWLTDRIKKKKKQNAPPLFPERGQRERERERTASVSSLYVYFSIVLSLFFCCAVPLLSFLSGFPFSIFVFLFLSCLRPFPFECNKIKNKMSWSQQAWNSHTLS